MIPRLILSLGADVPFPLISEDFKMSGAANAAAVVVVKNFLRVRDELNSFFPMIIKVLWIIYQ
jgi:hypothetical protein